MNWSFDNPLFRFLGRIADFMILNLLWIFCSIPIFTIGASTAALYTVMLKIVKNEEGYIFKGFLQAFKENFKKATAIWLVLLAIGGILGVDLWIGGVAGVQVLQVLRIPFLVLEILVIGTGIYAFALQARFENSVKNTLKNAVLLLFAKLPYTILMLVVTMGPVVVTLLSVRTLILGVTLWIFIGVSLVVWINSILLRRIFEPLEQN